MKEYPFAVGQRVRNNGDYAGYAIRGIVTEQVSLWFVRILEDNKNRVVGCSTTMLMEEVDERDTTAADDQAV
jgi:hypothetical protein